MTVYKTYKIILSDPEIIHILETYARNQLNEHGAATITIEKLPQGRLIRVEIPADQTPPTP